MVMVGLVILFSMLFVLGVVLALVPSGSRPRTVIDRKRASRLASRFTGSVAAGLGVFVTSGWLAPGLVVGTGGFWAIGRWQRRERTSAAEIAKLDALASWIENVRDVLMAGEQPIGAITSTVGACPPVIRTAVRRLATGLGRQDPNIVFRTFADDLDDPLGDLVAAGLSIAIRRGARTVPVLSALAEQTRQQVERRRLVEAPPAPTTPEIQAQTLIMGGLVVGLLVFGRSAYLDSYDRPSGQIFLAGCLTGYVLLIVRVQKLAAFPRPGRFLTSGTNEPIRVGR
jgi:hypothetical protein